MRQKLKGEETHLFGSDVMSKEIEIASMGFGTAFERKEIRSNEGWRREIWESKRKCTDEEGHRVSAVRIDLLYKGNQFMRASVSEIREGKLFKTEFDCTFAPIPHKSTDSRIAYEHMEKLSGFLSKKKEEFSQYALDQNTAETTIMIYGSERQIYLPQKIVSAMHLQEGTSCIWEREGNSLVLTPIEETAIPVKISGYNVLQVVVPQNMLLAGELKRGDYARWSVEDGKLSLRKADWVGPDCTRLYTVGAHSSNSIIGTIPKTIADELKIEKGMYGIWTFDKTGLLLEIMKDKPHIVKITQIKRDYDVRFSFKIPKDFAGLETGEVLLEVREGKLYITKKEGTKT
ncbi:MAG: hypothetical protein QXF56_05605 [Candidatus Micrarchaeia archaeon]